MKMVFEVVFKGARTEILIVDYIKDKSTVEICEKLLSHNENVLKVHFLGWYNGATLIGGLNIGMLETAGN